MASADIYRAGSGRGDGLATAPPQSRAVPTRPGAEPDERATQVAPAPLSGDAGAAALRRTLSSNAAATPGVAPALNTAIPLSVVPPMAPAAGAVSPNGSGRVLAGQQFTPQPVTRQPAIRRSARMDTVVLPEQPARPSADRFLDVLNAAPTPTLRPLPERFAALAQAVVGHTDVMVRHDSGARAALVAVGKRAATMGNTIVLPDRPGSGTDTGVLAHELTHIAHPSPLPRFYADDRSSSEERQADAVARLIRRSPSLRSAAPTARAIPASLPGDEFGQLHDRHADVARSSPGSSNPGSSVSSAVLRRSVSPARPAMSAPSTQELSLTPPPPRFAAPSPLAGERTSSSGTGRSVVHRGSPGASSSTGSANGTIRRSTAATPSAVSSRHSAPIAAAPAAAATIRRAVLPASDSGPTDSGTTRFGVPILDNMTTTAGVVEFVDWIIEKVEDRVIAELQRRGDRFKEDF